MPASQHTRPAASDSIYFALNGEITAVRDIAPTKTVLHLLREDLGKTGTKEGCAEGDCGACTVVLGELQGDRLAMQTVNACLQFVPTLDGKALFTVEHLRQVDGTLHPVQAAMVACHGSQCGFCTPGFVMSLWALYLAHARQGSRPTPAQIRTALSGNLCRCTGYRPILEAGEKMFDLPTVAFDSEALCATLKFLRRSEALIYAYEGQRFYAPQSLAELTRLRVPPIRMRRSSPAVPTLGVDNLFGVISSKGNRRTRVDVLRTDSILRPLPPRPLSPPTPRIVCPFPDGIRARKTDADAVESVGQ